MEDEINFLDYWRVLVRGKRLIALVVVCVTVVSIIYSLLASEIYRAEASLLPIGGEQSTNIASVIAQTGLGGELFGGMMGGVSSATTLMAVLESRTLAERVIAKMNLMKVFFKKLWDSEKEDWKVSEKDVPSLEEGVRAFQKKMKFQIDKKTTLIEITAYSKDPKFVADLVNTVIDELSTYLVENELTSAKRNRIFVERQLEKNKILLLETGKELSQFYGNRQISNIDSRLDVDVSINTIKGNPLSPTDKGRLGQLEEERSTLENKIRQVRLVKAVPQQVYLEYLTGYYQLLGQINALLTQQYEMAKIDETREDVSFNVIDSARIPARRFKPKRRLIVMISFTMSFFMAVFIVFFLEYMKKMRQNENTI